MSPRRLRSASTLAAVALSLAACGDPRPVAHGTEANDCTRCHGYPPATGAHAVHVSDAGIACAICHGASAGAPGHFGAGPPVIQFTGLALAGGATPSYAAATKTCSGVYCHGGTLGAGGTDHAPTWTGTISGCSSCHAAPPPPPHLPAQVAGTPPPPICNSCHPTTVDASGNIVPAAQGGTHVNGRLDGGGHQPGFDQPSVHGREFFAVAASPTPNACQQCHGTDYGNAIVPPAAAGEPNRSCNGCHAAAGWSGAWQANCSFCHGQRNATTQAGPYDPNARPTWAAPPDAISQRLTGTAAPDRTGAHGGHLSSQWATIACAVCHAVPTTVAHIQGADVRARVVVTAPGKASDPGAYDPASGTCATYCHDPIGGGAARSPAWTAATLACGGCHPVPPTTEAHLGLTGLPANLGAECSGCHPNTVTPSGAINLAAGAHVNGTVDGPAGHPAGFYLPSSHGVQYLNTLAGAPGALDCASCHGGWANCDGCHANPAAQASPARPELASYTTQWVGWRSNCTFCHGTRTADFNGQPRWLAAPPDAVSQRLDGVEVPERIGWHSVHLQGGGFAPAPSYDCSGCHAVPAAIDDAGHVTADRRAAVVLGASAFPGLSPADAARLPTPLGTYDPSTGACAVYCHGSTMQGDAKIAVVWTNDPASGTPIYSCTDCHGSPPASGSTVVGHTYAGPPATSTMYCGAAGCSDHVYHRNAQNVNGYGSCANCHYGSAQGTAYAGLHANGRKDVVPSGSSIGTKPVTFTWDATARTCSNVSCHVSSGAGAQSW